MTHFIIITEAGLDAFARYHRENDPRTITLPSADYFEDDWTPPSGVPTGPAHVVGV